MTPRRSWLEDSTGVVVDGGGRFDLVPSRIHVRELIRRRVTAVAMGLRDGAVVSRDLLGDAGSALADAFARDARTHRSLLGESDG
jgi:hypothetical protein